MKRLVIFLALLLAGTGISKADMVTVKLDDEIYCPSPPSVDTKMILDGRFVNIQGGEVAPRSCVGDICWSWNVCRGKCKIYIYGSTLPVEIRNSKRLTESVASIIRNSSAIRKSAGFVVQEIQKSISAVSESAGEKSKSKSETKEKSVSVSFNSQFHRFLTIALSSSSVTNDTNIHVVCAAGAVDLFMRMYFEDRVDDLLKAYFIFKSVKPGDLRESKKSDFISRAYRIYRREYEKTGDKEGAWARAVLYAILESSGLDERKGEK